MVVGLIVIGNVEVDVEVDMHRMGTVLVRSCDLDRESAFDRVIAAMVDSLFLL